MPFSFVLPLLRLESRKYLCAHDEQAETLRSPNVGIICGGGQITAAGNLRNVC